MNFFKRDLDTMMETIRLLSKRGKRPLNDEEQAMIDKCNEIYERAMVDHQKSIEIRRKYRQEKTKTDPLYSRSRAAKEQYMKNHPEKENESPS